MAGWRKEGKMLVRPLIGATVAVVLLAAAVGCARKEAAGAAARAGGKAVFETVYLWEGAAPGAKGGGPEDRPRLYVFAPEAGKATGAAVIVCPGGGYGGRAMEHEGVQVSRWLNSLGVTAFLLAYRVGGAGYTPDDAFTDAQRAVRLVRHRAKEFGVDPKRIGMIGFSAGGHLISRLGLYHDAGAAQASDPLERESSRPDFLLLCYTPTATGPWPENSTVPPAKVNATTPPTFIFHTTEDMVEPDGVIEWYRALRAAGVETELHIFGGYGPHGSGLSTGDPATSRWPELAAAWMRRNGFLTGKERASVEGMVTIDGKPMYIGYVTFTPVDSACDPIACGMVSGWVEMGKYQIPATHGPVPGKYRVEVRHTALAPSTEPVLMEEARYTKRSPKGEAMVVEIKPGGNVIDLGIISTAD
jgi:acetyl esterase/lipase